MKSMWIAFAAVTASLVFAPAWAGKCKGGSSAKVSASPKTGGKGGLGKLPSDDGQRGGGQQSSQSAGGAKTGGQSQAGSGNKGPK
jgi:hypothetical protein